MKNHQEQSALAFPQPLTEKYQPKTLDAFIGLGKPKVVLENFLRKPFPSAWLFLGPSGTGNNATGKENTVGEFTKISWCNHTQNFWVGCKAVSPGCDNCYAEFIIKKFGGNFAQIKRTKTWGDPPKWQKAAENAGTREMVFTASFSDFFIPEADAWRAEAWKMIRECPNLNWQILTKRPNLIRTNLPADWGEGYPNVWLGVSIESNAYHWRIDLLRDIPARTRFLSAEPLVEDITEKLDLTGIHWVIVGGESGNGSNKFRPMDHQWARNIRDKCHAHDPRVAFFYKQSAAIRTEMGVELDGKIYHEYPNQ